MTISDHKYFLGLCIMQSCFLFIPLSQSLAHTLPLSIFCRQICDLADKYNALVFVDECHATGFFGKTGR